MHRAKVFLTVCAGLFLLALSYHLGARNAGAQSGTIVTGMTGYFPSSQEAVLHVITSNGDVFRRTLNTSGSGPLDFLGNFWSGSGPTPARTETWGALKSRYRGERGATPATQDR